MTRPAERRRRDCELCKDLPEAADRLRRDKNAIPAEVWDEVPRREPHGRLRRAPAPARPKARASSRACRARAQRRDRETLAERRQRRLRRRRPRPDICGVEPI
ncbi:MAG: hypothetical protein ACLUEK_10435 [Oscillospiraceae bacterium]